MKNILCVWFVEIVNNQSIFDPVVCLCSMFKLHDLVVERQRVAWKMVHLPAAEIRTIQKQSVGCNVDIRRLSPFLLVWFKIPLKESLYWCMLSSQIQYTIHILFDPAHIMNEAGRRCFLSLSQPLTPEILTEPRGGQPSLETEWCHGPKVWSFRVRTPAEHLRNLLPVPSDICSISAINGPAAGHQGQHH